MDNQKENCNPNMIVANSKDSMSKAAMVLPLSVDRLMTQQAGLDCQMHLLKQETFPCITKSKGMTPAFDLIPAGFDIIKYVDCCVDYLVTHDIKAIIALNDIAALIAAAIGKEMKARHGIKLYVPSIQAAILCGHKLKTREVLDPYPIRFWAVEVENMSKHEPIAQPCFVKPTAALGSMGIFPINNKLDMAEAEKYMKANLKSMGGYLTPFFRKYTNMSTEEVKRIDPGNVVLCEQLIQATMIVYLDGTVDANGNISVWAVVDNNYHEKARFCFSDHCVPSRLYQERPDIVKALKKKFIMIAEGMVENGFQSSWFSMEFFVTFDKDTQRTGNVDIKLIEINGRMSAPMLRIYPMMGLDMIAKQVELSLGMPVSAPKQSAIDTFDPSATVGCLIYFSIFISKEDDGIRTEDVLDFDEVELIQREEKDLVVTMKVFPGNHFSKSDCKSGTRLGYISFCGPSRKSNMARAIELQRRMLKRPEMAPWHPEFKRLD